jgi:hypothetical protein
MQIDGGKPKLHGVNLELAAGALGAVIVVVWGLWLAKRQEAAKPAATEEKTETGNS